MNKNHQRNLDIKKICLGTANFGSAYGYKKNKLNKEDLKKIIYKAKKENIKFFDTAFSYKDSEKILGKFANKSFEIITKIPKVPSFETNIKKWIKVTIDKSFKNLKKDKIYGILIHDIKVLENKRKAKIILKYLEELKNKKKIQKIGISVYSLNELKKCFKVYNFQIVQFPFNIFDNRIIKSKLILKLKKQNVELHARSIFLQGLLLENSKFFEKRFQTHKKKIILFEKWLEKNNLNKLQACLKFAFKTKIIDKFVIGISKYDQLIEIIKILKKRTLINSLPKELKNVSPKLLNPKLWN